MHDFSVTVVTADAELRTLFSSELERLGVAAADQADQVDSIVQRPDVPEKQVILLHLPQRESIRDLEVLSSRLPNQPVMVVTGVEDARWLAQCVRLGALQLVLLPLRRQELAESLERLVRLIGPGAPPSQVITVTGAQGGQGATFVACNLAAAMAELVPAGVVLADMSVNFGAVANYLDIEPQYSTLDLLTSEDGIDVAMVNQALHAFSDRIRVLAAPVDAIGMRRASPEQIQALLSCLRMVGQVAIVDVPCTYDAQYFTYLTGSDRVVMLVEKKVPAVRALTRVADKLLSLGYPRERIFVTVNRDGTGDPAIRAEDITKATGLPISHTIPNDYPIAAGSMNMGKLMNEFAPNHAIWQRIKQLAKLLQEELSPSPSRHGQASRSSGTVTR